MLDTRRSAEATVRVGTGGRAEFVVDDDCVCVEASLGASRLLGRSREDLVGLPLSDLFEHSSAAGFNHVWRAFRDVGGRAAAFELRAPATPKRVAMVVTAGVLPGRHVVRLDPGVDPTESSADSKQTRMPSARESQVLALLTQGASDREIGVHLQLSPATVQTHVRNAKSKLGARTRAQAVAIAIRRGLISVDFPGGDAPS